MKESQESLTFTSSFFSILTFLLIMLYLFVGGVFLTIVWNNIITVAFNNLNEIDNIQGLTVFCFYHYTKALL